MSRAWITLRMGVSIWSVYQDVIFFYFFSYIKNVISTPVALVCRQAHGIGVVHHLLTEMTRCWISHILKYKWSCDIVEKTKGCSLDMSTCLPRRWGRRKRKEMAEWLRIMTYWSFVHTLLAALYSLTVWRYSQLCPTRWDSRPLNGPKDMLKVVCSLRIPYINRHKQEPSIPPIHNHHPTSDQKIPHFTRYEPLTRRRTTWTWYTTPSIPTSVPIGYPQS